MKWVNNTNNKVERTSHPKYFLPRVNITNYKVLIDGKNFYDQPVAFKSKNMIRLGKFQQWARQWLRNKIFVGLSII